MLFIASVQSIVDFISYTECLNSLSEMEYNPLYWTTIQIAYIFPTTVCSWNSTSGDSYAG